MPSPEIADDGLLEPAFKRLRNAIYDFQNFTGELFAHFAYGSLTYNSLLKII